jgi:CNT family concentrative nucleoside transporter
MKRPTPALVVLWTITALLACQGAWSTLGAGEDGGGAPSAEASAPPGFLGADVPDLGADATQTPPARGAQISVPRGALDTPLLPRLRSLVGLLVLALLAWALSVDRARVQWRVVGWGIGLQLLFALFILKTPVGAGIFDGASAVVVALLGFTVDGARFIFGNLVFDNVPVGTGVVGQGDFSELPGQVARTGASFAFNVLPTIIFFSSLMTVLYHLGAMQLAVKGVAWVMQRTMRTSGAETLSAAGNIFVGQTEAPLLIKPFIDRMTMSELMAVMTGGFATVAGGVLAAYVGILLAYFPDIAGHLMAASVMSAPAALVVAKLMYPEDGEPETAGTLAVEVDKPDVNVIDAAARGASEGLFLALNVGAMLLAFVALIYLLNGLLGWSAGLVGLPGLTLERVLGWLLAPLAWIMGVPWTDAPTVASLMGIKTVLNEFVAYFQLADMLGGAHDLQPRSIIIVTYALSGFANFSSIAIQIGGIGGIAPDRRHDLSRIGLRAMIAGSIAAFMTATVAGMVL